MSDPASDALRADAERLRQEIVGWRRALHRRPELGFEERETAALVERALRGMGLEPRTGVARTGVVAVLRAPSPGGPAVLLRADMDGLPVQEVEGREYGSEIPGRMHACGHDGHTAMLLGAAALLASRRTALARDVVLCFQPGEEGFGGAREMVAAGILAEHGVGEAYALHLWTPFRAGTIQVRSGPTMAAQDEFTATFVGRGGHGALPHHARDPIVAASLGVVALQQVVSRAVDPLAAAVATVGSFHAGSAPNVIPDAATLVGTLRSFQDDVRETLRDRVPRAFDGAASAAGCTLDFELRRGYPAVVNDPACVELARRAARRVVGDEAVIEPPPVAAAEDFAYFLKEVPGAFLFVGAGDPGRGLDAPHHSPRFDIDEAVLPRGAELLARIALERA